MTILLAIISAALYGVGVALQQRPSRNTSIDDLVRPHLLVILIRRPVWLLGMAAEVGGFAAQVAALHGGALLVVQPLITTSLLFTLALSGLWSDQPLRAFDWLAAGSVVVGLGAFLVVARPGPSNNGAAPPAAWAATMASIAFVVAVLVVAGIRARSRARAAMLAAAAGLGDATMAVLTKAFAQVVGHGVAAAARSWTPYALAATGMLAMLLTQSAYQAGRPAVSLPILTIVDPVVSSAIGVGLFGEALQLGGGRGPAVLATLVLMGTGLVVLSRSPLRVSAESPTATHPTATGPTATGAAATGAAATGSVGRSSSEPRQGEPVQGQPLHGPADAP